MTVPGRQSGASMTSTTIIRSGSTGRPRQAIGSMASDCISLRTRFWIRSNPSSSDWSHSWLIPWASRRTTSVTCSVIPPQERAAEPGLARVQPVEGFNELAGDLLRRDDPGLLDLVAASIERPRRGSPVPSASGLPADHAACSSRGATERNCSIAWRSGGSNDSACSCRPRVLFVCSFSSCRSAVNSSTRSMRPNGRLGSSLGLRLQDRAGRVVGIRANLGQPLRGSGSGRIRCRRGHSCGIRPGGQDGDREPGGRQSAAQRLADHLEGIGRGSQVEEPGLEPACRIAQRVVGRADLREPLGRRSGGNCRTSSR